MIPEEWAIKLRDELEFSDTDLGSYGWIEIVTEYFSNAMIEVEGMDNNNTVGNRMKEGNNHMTEGEGTNVEHISEDELLMLTEAKQEVDMANAHFNRVVRTIARKYRFDQNTRLELSGVITRPQPQSTQPSTDSQNIPT